MQSLSTADQDVATLPIRKGEKGIAAIVESAADAATVADDAAAVAPATAYIPAASETVSVNKEAAPVVPSPLDCPRCGGKLMNPDSLGWCAKCGYCRSL